VIAGACSALSGLVSVRFSGLVRGMQRFSLVIAGACSASCVLRGLVRGLMRGLVRGLGDELPSLDRGYGGGLVSVCAERFS
jgi:hypothetical protein